jgi:hypothetical protein
VAGCRRAQAECQRCRQQQPEPGFRPRPSGLCSTRSTAAPAQRLTGAHAVADDVFGAQASNGAAHQPGTGARVPRPGAAAEPRLGRCAAELQQGQRPAGWRRTPAKLARARKGRLLPPARLHAAQRQHSAAGGRPAARRTSSQLLLPLLPHFSKGCWKRSWSTAMPFSPPLWFAIAWLITLSL